MARKKRLSQKQEELFSVAQWYKHLCETNNYTFIPLFADTHRFLVLKGGGGSGKSIFAGRKILERAVSEPGHRFLVCRKVGKTIRNSCFEQLKGQLSQFYSHVRYKVNESDMRIEFANGSKILFSGLDDVEKLKSIYNITGIWIEEATELLESDFNQLNIRLRGETKYYKQIIITFNPVSIKHWLKKRFFDRHDPDATVHESTYLDNRFLPEEDKRTLENFKNTDLYYYMVYCLGQWGVTGKSVFNAQAIAARLELGIKPIRIGRFGYSEKINYLADIAFTEDKDGELKIYKEPIPGVPYVIGADTAGDGSDFFVAQVLDNRTGEQVAVLRHQFAEDVFARQLYCLGMYYNGALIAAETNYSTYPTMELERLHYPKMYIREKFDDITHQIIKSYGFLTNKKTRPVIIAELIKAMREDISLVSDEETLNEMQTFVRNEDFRPEAEAGCHDDCVMALAIAHYIRPRQDYLAAPDEKESTVWTADMYEDYENADADGKAYLIKKWGTPRR